MQNGCCFRFLLLLALIVASSRAAEETGEQRQFTERIRTIIEKGSLEELNRALKAGGKSRLTCSWSEVLRLASVYDRAEMATLAIERGADPNAPEKEEDLPITCAVRGGHVKLAEELARHGARLTAPAAAIVGDAAQLSLLVTRDPDLLDRTWYYDPFSTELNLLHLAALTGREECIRVLLQLGADPEEDDSGGFSALYHAALNGHLDAVRELYQYDKRIDHASKYGWTPLIAAASEGHEEIVSFLLRQNARYDLFTAICRGDLRQAQALVAADQSLLKTEVGLNRPLGWAARCGKVEMVDWLHAQGAEVDWRAPDDDDSALQAAAWCGYEDVVRLLIKKGANLNIGAGTDAYGTALHRAAWRGHGQIVRMLLDAGADLEAVDNTDETPLVFAVKENRLDIARQLLKAGANVDGKEEHTPLRSAIWDGAIEGARLLLEHGANMERARSSEGSVLHAAAERGHLEMVRLLLKCQPDCARKDPSALHIAVEGRWDQRYEAYFGIVRLLLDAGADVNACWRGRTPLGFTTDPRMARLLLDGGADVNARNENGQTALHKVYSAAVAEMLLDAGADINAVDLKGETPLHQAIAYSAHPGHRAVRDLLLKRGAKVDVFDAAALGRTEEVTAALKKDPGLARREGPGGGTLLNLAAEKGSLPLVKELLRLGADIEKRSSSFTPLHSAAGCGHAEVVQFLLEHGASVDAPCDLAQRPLYTAAMGGHTEVIRLLLRHGAAIDAETNYHRTALMEAAEEGHLQAVRALVEAGSKISPAVFEGALSRGRNEIVLYLLEKGADAKGAPEGTALPLHWATTSCSVDVICALVKAGAEVNATNKSGVTALDWARSNGRNEAARVLKQLGGLQAHQLLQLRRGQVAKLIPLLDDERFAVRQRAYRELHRFGAVIADLLRKARAETGSLQVRAQLDALLKTFADQE